MLTGELPGTRLQPPSNKVHIDVRLDEVVLRALEKEPSRRYQQAGDVKTQVETIATSMEPPAPADAAAAVANAVTTISECAENDPRVETALRGLGPWNPAQVTTVLAQHLKSEKDTARRAAIYILWKGAFADIGPAVPSLQGLLQHPENFTRGMAALALGGNHITDSYAAVAKMAQDDGDKYARHCAGLALKFFGTAPPQSEIGSPILAYVAITFVGMSGVLGTIAWFCMPNPPQILVWAILAAALLGILLGIFTRKTKTGKTAIIVGGANAAVWLTVFALFAHFGEGSQPNKIAAASAVVRYRIFEADPVEVDRLVPSPTRQRSDEREAGLIYSRLSPNAVSQTAEISTGVLASLLSHETNGDLADSRREVSLWPRMADSCSYSRSSGGSAE